MREPSTLWIREIFWSAQGEGLKTGVPSIFIRFSGCQLRCPYCDTKDSWDRGEYRSREDIISAVWDIEKKYPSSQVVITGGEPLEQDLQKLVQDLKKADRYVALETNGLHYQDLPLDWWTVSPKDKGDFFIARELVPKINEVKLVVNRNLTLEVVRDIRSRAGKAAIFLQPQAGSGNASYEDTFNFYQRCIKEEIPGIRLGWQLHKVYGIN